MSEVDRPPPPVTVRDPSRPSTSTDLIGDDRKPWRPGKKLVLAALLVAATTAVLQMNPPPSIRLSLIAPLESQQDGELLLGLRDDAAQPVRVQRVRLDGDGFAWQQLDDRLGNRQATDLHLPITPICGSAQPAALLVDAQSADGSRHQLHLALDADRTAQLLAASRRVCGSYPLGESLQVTAPSARGSSAAEVVLQLDVEDLDAQPLTLLGIDAGRGFAVQVDPPLPLRLPGHAPPYVAGTDQTRLVVRVRVVDCRLLKGRGRQPDAPAVGQLIFAVARGGETASPALGFAPYGEPQLIALTRSCG